MSGERAKLGIIYHSKQVSAYQLAQEIKELLSGYQVWLATPQQEEEIKRNLPGTNLIFSLGGDGTLLRTACSIPPYRVPILGVNLGRVGFITEIEPQELKEKLPAILKGEGWIEERAMLQAEMEGRTYHALNDIVLARGAEIKLMDIKVTVDGEELTTYRTDGVILATATGSTAYNLSVGGPILYPHSQDFILKPIYTYLGCPAAVILPANSYVELELLSKGGILGIDGQLNIPLERGQRVKVKRSPFGTQLLRLKPPLSFYRHLAKLLNPWK